MDEDKYDSGIFYEKFSTTGAKTRRKDDIFPVTMSETARKRSLHTGTSTSVEQKKAVKLPDRTVQRNLVPNKVRGRSPLKKNSIKVQSNIKCTILKKRKNTNRNANDLTANSPRLNKSLIIIDDEVTEGISKPRICNKKISTEPLLSLESRSMRSVSRTNKTKKVPTNVMTVCRDSERARREYFATQITNDRDRREYERSRERLLRENYARNVTSTVTSGALQTWREPLALQNNVYPLSSNWNSNNASPYSVWSSDSDLAVAQETEENNPVLPLKPTTPLETTMQKKLYLGACPICFEELMETQIGATICGHVFCMSCITQTVEHLKYCPNCRKRLEPTDIISLYF